MPLEVSAFVRGVLNATENDQRGTCPDMFHDNGLLSSYHDARMGNGHSFFTLIVEKRIPLNIFCTTQLEIRWMSMQEVVGADENMYIVILLKIDWFMTFRGIFLGSTKNPIQG